MRRRLFIGTIASMICLMMLSVGASEQLTGKGHGRQGAKQVLGNVGFMKNPPRELKERFPMCDNFLKVNWIDKQKKIGYSRYDLYKDRRKITEKEKAFALIHLDEARPCFDYDLSVFKGPGRLGTKRVFSKIRKGEIVMNPYLTLWNGEVLDFQFIASTRDIWDYSLADYTMNICIPYPDNARMWIAEGKRKSRSRSFRQPPRVFKWFGRFHFHTASLASGSVVRYTSSGVLSPIP